MQVTQIYEIVNDVTKEILGDSAVLNEDLSNIVEIGTKIFDANATDVFTKKLINRIGRVIWVNRAYSGGVPSVLMDSWEYGSRTMKIMAEMPEATENESWELQDGASYDPNIFTQPKLEILFRNNKVTFEIPLSLTEMQVKQSLGSAAELAALTSMLYNEIDKSMTVKMDALIMRTINNMIGETVYDEYAGAALNTKSGVRAVNLLKLYNDKFSKSLTASQSVTDPEFIRFASFTIGVYKDRMSKISTLFNVGRKARFTPSDLLHVVLLSEFKNAAAAYLQSDTYHDEYVKLINAETVPYWQGSGTDYGFDSTSKIDIKTASNNTVVATGILAVMFDRDALGVTNMNRRVTSNYNPKAEFYNSWFKVDAGYFNDLNENFVVFFVA